MITLEVKGDEELIRKLDRLSRKVKNREVLHKRYGVAGARYVSQTFQREGRPRWKPLLPQTARAKVTKTRRRGTAHILRVRGDLARSFTWEASRLRALVGSNKEIARYHHDGTKHLPVRATLPTKKQALEEITLPITQDYVDESIRKAGL